MRISELRDKSQEMLDRHGDVEVFLGDGDTIVGVDYQEADEIVILTTDAP